MKRALIAAVTLLASPALAQEAAAPPAPAPAAIATMGPALHVTSIDRSLKFYVDGLGMKKLMQMGAPARRETMIGIAGEAMRPALILLDDATRPSPAPIAQSNGYDRLVLRVSGLPDLVARLRGLGFSVTDVRTAGMGFAMALATDPDGYKLELVESPQKRSK